jgi:hypothetical protein
MVFLPLAAVEEGAEVINGKEESEGKTYQGKDYQHLRVKVGLGYVTENAQGKKQDIDAAYTVYHGKNTQNLGNVGLLLPKVYEMSHGTCLLANCIRAARRPPF